MFSTSTLMCCTIPALLSVIVGAATVASTASTIPGFITFAIHKKWIFIITAAMLLLNAAVIYRPRASTADEVRDISNRRLAKFFMSVCDIDAKEYCEPVSKAAKIIFWVSVLFYIIGFTFAYILPYLLYGI
jgi:hypothetical protein